MKRHNNLFDKIVDKDNLLLAYKKAKKHKNWQQKVIRVEKDLDNLIEGLRLSLINGTYKTAEYRTKKIYEPKERTIYVLPFYPDRIVHHAIMNILEPIWDNLFISDSYACRNGKGQHKGSQKCMEFVRKNKYCLKCDISKFYPSINHEILKLIIRKKIKCKRTLNLLDTIIDSIDGETNIPIGNYLSQWFGNLYLNELEVLNKEIKVLAFQVKKSKIEKDGFYIQMQIEVDDERKVLFTNSSVLKDQLEKYKDNLPFITTIIQPKKYFSFS